MYLTLKQQVKHLSKKEFKNLKYLCHIAKNLKNQAIYNVRQHYFKNKKYLSYNENYKMLKNSEKHRSHKFATTYAVLLAYTLLNKLRRLASNFLIFLLSTDYILSHSFICLGLPTSTSFGVLPSRGIVVEPYLTVLAADCPLY